jgi:hypothetical protein
MNQVKKSEGRGLWIEKQLKNGEGLSSDRPMKAFTYDGKNWHTCELNEIIKGEPVEVVTVPPPSRGGWNERQ